MCSEASSRNVCVAPVVDCPGALGRVKTALRRCAVLTRPARSQGVGKYWSDAVKDLHRQTAHHAVFTGAHYLPGASLDSSAVGI